jgi:hypothetical protein
MSNKNNILQDMLNFINLTRDINYKLSYLNMLGVFFKYNNLGCYSLPDVEKELIKIIVEQYDIRPKGNESTSSKQIAFIITEPYESGGHTRLMERLSSFLPQKPDLFVTHNCSAGLKNRLSGLFSSVKVINLDYCDVLKNIMHFAEVLTQYEKLVLNIHPEDISSVIAVGIAKTINPLLMVYYVNHADHVFSWGVSISDVWFEISMFGKKIDEFRNIECRRTFLGIPLDISNTQHTQKIIDGDNFLASGAAFKFKPYKCFTIIPPIERILKYYPHSTVTIIGVRPYIDYWWWPLKLKFPKRLILESKLPYDKYLKVASGASVFIDSHPLPGGTAFAEQFLKGKKCIGITSPVQGYSPVELFKSNTIEDSLVVNSPEKINDILNKAIEVHSFSKVGKRFVDALNSGHFSKNKCEELIPWSGDEKYLEVKKIVRIPPQFHLKNAFTKRVIKLTAKRIVLRFLMEKSVINLKRFLRET